MTSAAEHSGKETAARVSDGAAGNPGDGLLGRDFLDHFSVNIDTAAGVVTLTPK